MERKKVIEHISELRARIILIGIVFVFLFVLGFILSNKIMQRINEDLLNSTNAILIATHPLEYFIAKLNIGVFFALIFSLPLILYEVYAFLKPGLKVNERKIFKISIISCLFLFALGFLFSYFVIVKFVVLFFASFTQESGIQNFWDVNEFVNFVFMSNIIMGVIFQIPIISLMLVKSGLITVEMLKANRGYVIILNFVIAAIITPTPDPFTQILVAMPMCFLYEISIWVAKIFS
ncbi:MAG: twin-arginine translocase subunit TatC [Candidatus Aenigmatarchaeota archaeon]